MPSSSIISSADTLTTVQPSNRFLRGTTIPTNFVYSYLVTPKKLLAARSFWLLYQLIVILVTFAYYIKPPYFKYFFFFTNLTYFGLCVYLALAIFNSYRQLYTPLPPSTFAITLQQILYCNIAVFHLMVPTVYWLFLAQGYKSSIDAWTSISQHGIEFLVVVTEFFLGRMILNWWGLVIDVLIMGIYVGWSWVYNSYSNDFVYPFLDVSRPEAKFMYPALMIVSIVLYIISYGFHKLRDRIFSNPDEIIMNPPMKKKLDMEMSRV